MSYIKAIANGLSAEVSVRTISNVVYKMAENKYLKIAFTTTTEPVTGYILTDENGNILTNENGTQLTGQ